MIPVELLELGKTVALPLGVTLVLASLAQALSGRARVLAAALGAALAYGAADWWIAGPPGFPPRDVTHWVPWLMAGGVLAALFGQDRRPASVALWLLLAAALTWLLFRPILRNGEWTAPVAVAWFAGTGVVLAAVWSPLQGEDRRAGALLFQLALVAVAASACAMLGHSQKQAQLAGSMAVVAGAGLAPWLGVEARRAVATSASVGLAGLLTLSLHYSNLGLWTALLLSASWATTHGTARSDLPPPRRRAALALGLVLALAAVGVAVWARLNAPEDPYGYGY